MKKIAALIIIYVVGVLLTYGRNYHEFVAQKSYGGPLRESDAALEAVFCGIFWPVYWPFRCARKAFEPKQTGVEQEIGHE